MKRHYVLIPNSGTRIGKKRSWFIELGVRCKRWLKIRLHVRTRA